MQYAAIPLLGYAVLGLLHEAPLSGYGVRKLFASSPMGSFSDSPGAIYPALQRLEKAGLIRGRVEDGSGLRRKKIFQLTESGTAALKQWLKQPVTRDDVVRSTDELMLRFSFMDNGIGEAATVRFLKSFRKELADYIPSLREYLNSNRAEIPRSGILALESGVRSYETLLEWCDHAIKTYENN
jgi:DNA-binding PadR family transcriptional regulator